MREIKFTDRVRYAFDNSMSRGTIALIGWLALISLVVVFVAGALISLGRIAQEGSEPVGFLEAAWESLVRTLDSGTFGGDTGWGFRFVMLGVTIGGIFIVSALIGVLNTGLEARLTELRKGRSFVVEENHTLILGWSSKIFTILSEIVIANANQTKPRIVILAEKDKVEMEDEIRDRVGPTGKTKIICRTGNPIDVNDLEIVNPHSARSIIILPPDDDDSDSSTIKSILALTNNPNRRREPYHIVAELRDPKDMDVARMVGRDETQLVLAGDLISRIIVQTCRQSGLSVVYTELLDFGGDEIYFADEPRLVGRTFGEALFAYEDSALIGLRFADGRVQLNPPMDTCIKAGDRVIAVSEDNDTVRMSDQIDSWADLPQRLGVDPNVIREGHPTAPQPERTLILGWHQRGPSIINQLDSYVAPGSEVMVVADLGNPARAIHRYCADVKNVTVSVVEADTTERLTLDSLNIPSYNQVIILCYSDTLDPQAADARTLITLLHLRDIADKGGDDFRIVSEMLDLRNRELADVTKADDFIVSDRLISLMLSQVSENKELSAVFADLFDPAGSEIYLKPAGDYVALGQPLNFYTVVEAARRRSEVPIGYRLHAEAGNAARSYGVVVNPDKSNTVTFTAEDRIIVLAEQ